MLNPNETGWTPPMFSEADMRLEQRLRDAAEDRATANQIKKDIVTAAWKQTINPKYFKPEPGKIIALDGDPADAWSPLDPTPTEPCTCGGSGGEDGKIDPNIHAQGCPARKMTGVTQLASGEIVTNASLYGPPMCACGSMMPGVHESTCAAYEPLFHPGYSVDEPYGMY